MSPLNQVRVLRATFALAFCYSVNTDLSDSWAVEVARLENSNLYGVAEIRQH